MVASAGKDNDDSYSRSLVRQSRIQNATNVLVALFTLLLATISYTTERPYVAVRWRPITNFIAGEPVRLSLALENIGHTPAYQVTANVGTAMLPYPMTTILPTDAPPASNVPLTLYAYEPTGLPITTRNPLYEKDAEAIRQGAKTLLYVWGTVHYKDALWWPHSTDFCFAYGGPNMESSAGICTINEAQQYILESKPQPHAQPNLLPAPPIAFP